MTSPSFRDVEQISALLDGQLPQQEAARLQMRIAADPELSGIYRQLSQSRALLRKLPARRAPRNFTLTPKMAGVKAPTPRIFPLFRLASAFASLLLVLTFAVNGLGQLAANAPASAPAYGLGGGPMTEAMEQPAAPEAASSAEEILPQAAPQTAATHAPVQDSTVPATEESMRSLAVEATQPVEEMPAAKLGGQETQEQEQQAIETPARQPFQVPGGLQLVLLVIALLAGGAAWLINWQARVTFDRKHRK